MDELDISDFKYGGVNLTGFAIINTSSARYQSAQRIWTRRNPNYWLGARRRLTVRLVAWFGLVRFNVPLDT